jgi:curved DNA-binding protein
MKFQDYYEILGVPRGASADEIKKAYRKLAMKWHPDRHAEGDRAAAEEKFKSINEAKEVLTDTEKRAKYDRFGANWQHGQEFTPPGGSGWRTVNPEEFGDLFGGGGFSDFFGSLFGDDLRAQVGRRRGPSRGADAQAEIHLTISDIIRGGAREFSLGTVQDCEMCGGSGVLDEDHACPACGGLGRVRGRKTVELKIPRDVRDGMALRLRGLGEAGERGGESGDLYLTVRVQGDDVYRRQEADIYADVPVAPWEALEGAKVDLRTMDGTVILTLPPNSRSGDRLRMRGLGLRREGGSRGDLFAVIRIALPEGLSEQQKELLKQLRTSGPTEIKGGARA